MNCFAHIVPLLLCALVNITFGYILCEESQRDHVLETKEEMYIGAAWLILGFVVSQYGFWGIFFGVIK
jgi:hypothetical protein